MKDIIANQRYYLSFVEISGICWGAAIVLFLKDGLDSISAVMMLCISLFVMLYLIGYKYRLMDSGVEELYALKERYGLIIMDFLLKYCVYGLGACILNIFVNPKAMSLSLNLSSFTLGIHLFFIIVVRFFYSTYAKSERQLKSNLQGGNVNG